jgi:uncharacterized membrane protein YhaH (DUF805 family)
MLMNEAEIICRRNSFAGFFINIDTQPREVVLRIPLVALILLFGIAPTLALVGRLRLRARRKSGNLCLSCGYDLTGNTSGTCLPDGSSVGGQRFAVARGPPG